MTTKYDAQSKLDSGWRGARNCYEGHHWDSWQNVYGLWVASLVKLLNLMATGLDKGMPLFIGNTH